MPLGDKLIKKSSLFTKEEIWTFNGATDTADWLTLNLTLATLTRGSKKKGTTLGIRDVSDIGIEGQHGRSFAPGKLLALGVLGATKQTSTAYLVIDSADAQWRIPIKGGCDRAAQELIEKVVTWQRQNPVSS